MTPNDFDDRELADFHEEINAEEQEAKHPGAFRNIRALLVGIGGLGSRGREEVGRWGGGSSPLR